MKKALLQRKFNRNNERRRRNQREDKENTTINIANVTIHSSISVHTKTVKITPIIDQVK